MSALAYFLGLAQLLLVIGSLGYIAFRLQRRLIPGWSGAPGYLAAAVSGVGLLMLLSQLLGVFGILYGWALLLASLLLALAARYYLEPRSSHGEVVSEEQTETPGPLHPPVGGYGFWLALLVSFVVVAQWAAFTSYSLDAGISNFDSVWYHLPFAADMFQSGSTLGFHRTETVFLNWFYPQNSELIHAAGMALTDTDFFSVLVNMGWLALALLAAWCVGRPYGRPHLTLIAAAVVLATHTLVVREPGTAKNDIMAIALILSSVAILVNRSADPADAIGRIGPGWALAAAGLATGLAAGTKVTALAPAAMITIVVLISALQGTRLRSTAVWFGAGILGGGFWYLRNLVATGNPIPQVTAIGPISLPGPERLQEGRPDFNVFHYIGDTAIWREYFFPGLEQGFGALWPVLLALGAIGSLALVFRGPGRLVRVSGVAALLAIAAYLFTPLGAAGPEGSPDAFSINLRFLVPALAMALVLVPLVSWFDRPRPQLGLGLILLLLFFITGSNDALLSQSGRYFGVAVAFVFVAVPALIWHYRDRLPEADMRRASLSALAGATVLLGLLASWPLASGYQDSRYSDFEPEAGMAEPYRWASGIEDSRIGLAGTTAGFRQYGFFGEDLSNRVIYIGREAPAGGFDVIRSCPDFRRAVNEARLDYLVTSPFLNFLGNRQPLFSPERGWIAGDPAVSPELDPGPVEVWRVNGRLDPESCGPGLPREESTPGLVTG